METYLWTGVAPTLAAAGTGVTGVLLTWDLKRPDRVLNIFTTSNPSSWLFLGSSVLVGYSAVAGAWLATGTAEALGLINTPAAASPLGAM